MTHSSTRSALRAACAVTGAITVSLTSALPATAAVEVIPIAQFGDLSPDGDGSFGSFLDFGPPCLNDSTHVLFSARLQSNSGGSAADEVLVRGKPGGTRVIMARENALIPDGSGRYDNLRTPNRRYVLNNEGRAAFTCELTNTPGGTSDDQAIFSTDGPSTETLHVRKGWLAPGTTGIFTGLVAPTINNEMPCIVAFYAWAGGYGGAHPGTVYTNRAGTSTLIARVTDPAPGGGGTLFQFDESEPPSIEPDGNTVVFRAQLTSTPFGSQDDAAVYRGRGSALVQIVRGRDLVPGGGSHLDEPYYPTQNIMGNVAIYSTLFPTSDGDCIEIAGGDPDPDLVVITNRAHPDSVSKFDHFDLPALSAGNVSAFRATLKSTPNGGLDDEGIYRGDGTVLLEVAREGQDVPEGGGQFASFGHTVAINVNAEVLFLATLRNTPFGTADNRGLYLWSEEHGITKLVRKRDSIPSSGGVVLDILALSEGDFGGFRSLNDAGDAVAILDMDGLFAKDGVYLFRAHGTSDALAADAPHTRLVVEPNPWLGGPLRVALSSGREAPRDAFLDIYTAEGRRVRSLPLSAGSTTWDGVDARGNAVGSGLLFLSIRSRAGAEAARVVRLVR